MAAVGHAGDMQDADDALVLAIRDGSERAFNELVDRHQQAVRTFLRGVTSADDAEDIAQETFLATWTHARSYRGGNVRAWLFSIAWRKAKGAQRSWFRRRRRDADYHGAPAATRDLSAEDRLAVRQALAALPFAQRAAIILSFGCGLTHPEAAEALALPLGTVKSHILRGRDRLRAALGDKS
jgi:RNA polymerase sigma-70 factor (ECF subfamily)